MINDYDYPRSDVFLFHFFYKLIRRFTILSLSNSVIIQRLLVLILIINKAVKYYEAETILRLLASKLSVTAMRNYHISRLF